MLSHSTKFFYCNFIAIHFYICLNTPHFYPKQLNSIWNKSCVPLCGSGYRHTASSSSMKLYCAMSSARKNLKDLNYGQTHHTHLQDSHKQIIFGCTWLLTPLLWMCLKQHNTIEVAVKWCEVLKMADINCKTAEVNEIKSSWASVTIGTSERSKERFNAAVQDSLSGCLTWMMWANLCLCGKRANNKNK